MMDLAEVGLKNGLFVPTPGQWEQEYLSSYYKRKGWFMSKNQAGLRLSRDVERAEGYTGFPEMAHTDENVRKLYQDQLARYLE
jgi:hypothetical protein